MENNQVTLLGCACSDFEFSHEMYGEKFFQIMISIERTSGTTDIIPVVASERLIDVSGSYGDKYIYVEGQFRSYNMDDGKKKHLMLFVFASCIYTTNETESINQILLDGYICKEPTFRKTPFGREITDLIIASNRQYGKSDYIPCISWGRNAFFASSFLIGQHVSLEGRIQSREYMKNDETRIAYEVSIVKLDRID